MKFNSVFLSIIPFFKLFHSTKISPYSLLDQALRVTDSCFNFLMKPLHRITCNISTPTYFNCTDEVLILCLTCRNLKYLI